MVREQMPAQSKASSKARWRVVRADFEQSATESHQCPAADVPELAIAGRSNVGKSSLLNALSGRGGLARVSRTPGRTRLLNFFRLDLQGPRPAGSVAEAEAGGPRPGEKMTCALRLVDLPGYGFAKAARSVRESFGPMIEEYLTTRTTLRSVLVLIDARRGPSDQDLEMLEWATASNIPCMVCVTKVDKLGAAKRGLLPRSMASDLNIHPNQILLTSATEGIGIEDDGRGRGLIGQLGRLTALWHGVDGSETSAGPGL